jgi:uncharacterized protein
MPNHTHDHVIATTRGWLVHAVIGLNLCPFAKPVLAKNLIRFVVSGAVREDELLRDLQVELERLVATPPAEIETTLLIHPHVLADFFDFNDFLDAAEALVETLGYTGVLQIASFHPDYQFAGTAPTDVTNATNRSPYPLLHILREDSIEHALASVAAPDAIYRSNLLTLENLGSDGWSRLTAQYMDPPEI